MQGASVLLVGTENPSGESYKEQTTLDPTGHGGSQQPGNGWKAGPVAMLCSSFPSPLLTHFFPSV